MICLLNLCLWKMGDRNSQTKDAIALLLPKSERAMSTTGYSAIALCLRIVDVG
ncbi:MAG: hypothetical protein ACYT04_29940 [Nostoc sp.]